MTKLKQEYSNKICEAINSQYYENLFSIILDESILPIIFFESLKNLKMNIDLNFIDNFLKISDFYIIENFKRQSLLKLCYFLALTLSNINEISHIPDLLIDKMIIVFKKGAKKNFLYRAKKDFYGHACSHKAFLITNEHSFNKIFDKILNEPSDLLNCYLLKEIYMNYPVKNDKNKLQQIISYFYKKYSQKYKEKSLHFIFEGLSFSDEVLCEFIEKIDFNKDFEIIIPFLFGLAKYTDSKTPKLLNIIYPRLLKFGNNKKHGSSVFPIFLNTVKNLDSVNCIEFLNKILQDTQNRADLFIDNHCRIPFFKNFLSPFPVIYNQNITKDFTDIYTRFFKTAFPKESFEECVLEFSTTFITWSKFLNGQNFTDIFKLIFQEYKTTKKYPFLLGIIHKSLREKTIDNNDFRALSETLQKIIDQISGTPYSVQNSEFGLDFLSFVILNKDINTSLAKYYNQNNLEIFLHIRNFRTFSYSYHESCLFFISKLFKFNFEIPVRIYENLGIILFHTESLNLNKLLNILFENIESDKFERFFESFLLYIEESIKNFEAKNIQFSWSRMDKSRINRIVQKMLFYIVKSKPTSLNIYIEKILLLLGSTGMESSITQALKFINNHENIFQSFKDHIYKTEFGFLLKDSCILPESYYYTCYGIINWFKDSISTITKNSFKIWTNEDVLSITLEDMAIYQTSADQIFNQEVNENFKSFLELVPTNFKFQLKKDLITKESILKMSMKEFFSLTKDKNFFTSIKISQKLCRQLENAFETESEKRIKISKYVKISEVVFWVLKGVVDARKRELIPFYPYLSRKLIPLVPKPFLSEYVCKIMLSMGNYILENGLGNLLSLVVIRGSNPTYILPSELVSQRLEIQTVEAITKLSRLLNNNSMRLDEIFGILSFFLPISTPIFTCEEQETNIPFFKNVSNLLNLFFNFKKSKIPKFSFCKFHNTLLAEYAGIFFYRIENSTSESDISVISYSLLDIFIDNYCFILDKFQISDAVVNIFALNLTNPSNLIRLLSLRAFKSWSNYLNTVSSENWSLISSYCLINQFDSDQAISEISQELIQNLQLSMIPQYLVHILSCSENLSLNIQKSVSILIFEVIKEDYSLTEFSVEFLIEMYELIFRDVNEGKKNSELYIIRKLGILECFETIIEFLGMDQIKKLLLFIFIILVKDTDEKIQDRVFSMAAKICTCHGPEFNKEIIVILDEKSKSISKVKAEYNNLRKCLGLMMASMYNYLPNESPLKQIAQNQLIGFLNTPKKKVQIQIASCFPTLFDDSDKFEKAIQDLIKTIFNINSNPKVQRGSCLALAFSIKSKGICVLKNEDFKIIQMIYGSFSQNHKIKLMGIRCLKALYEICPMIIEPNTFRILEKFLDFSLINDQQLKNAVRLTMHKAIMNVSDYTLSRMIELILEPKPFKLHEKMNFLDYLSASSSNRIEVIFPYILQIVGFLNRFIHDSTDNLNKTSEKILRNFRFIITAPDLQSHKALMVSSLKLPVDKCPEFFKIFLYIRFNHTLDIGSFAFINLIIIYGLEMNSTPETKLNVLKILKNISSIISADKISKVVHILADKMKSFAFDSLPDIRESTALTYSVVCQYCTIDFNKQLISWYLEKFNSDEPIVQTSSPHIVSRVLGCVGTEYFEEIFQIAKTELNSSVSKIGKKRCFLLLLAHLPSIFKEDFKEFISQITPLVIRCLSDYSNIVSHAALLAGQSLVQQYRNEAINYLFPELEKGLIDLAWENRLGSLKLIRELFYTMAGVSISNDINSDENEPDNTVLLQKFSAQVSVSLKNKIIALLFTSRFDTDMNVKSESFKVWKNVIPVGASAVLIDIVPEILDILLECLYFEDYFHQELSQSCLIELLQKSSIKVVDNVIPEIYKKFSLTEDPNKLFSICLFLQKFVLITDSNTVSKFLPQIVDILIKTIVHSDPKVTDASCSIMTAIESVCGVDFVYPILDKVIFNKENQDFNEPLNILNYILSKSNRKILDYVLSKVLVQPIDFQLVSMICRQSTSIIGPEQVMLIMNSIVIGLCENVNNYEAFKNSKEVINSLNLQSIKIVLNKILDTDFRHESENKVLVLSKILYWCCQLKYALQNFEGIHAYCMRCLNIPNSRVIKTIMKIYYIVIQFEDTVSYKKKTLKYFLHEFNFQYGKYSPLKTARSANLYCFSLNDLDIQPIIKIIQIGVIYENGYALSDVIDFLHCLISMDDNHGIFRYIPQIISFALRIFARNLDWNLKYKVFMLIRETLNLKHKCDRAGNKVDLKFLIPQILAVFSKLMMDCPENTKESMVICDEIMKIQDIGFDVSNLLQTMIDYEKKTKLTIDKTYILKTLQAHSFDNSFLVKLLYSMFDVLHRNEKLIQYHVHPLIGLLSSVCSKSELKNAVKHLAKLLNTDRVQLCLILAHIVYCNLERFYISTHDYVRKICKNMAIHGWESSSFYLRITSVYLASHLTASRLICGLKIDNELIGILIKSLSSLHSNEHILKASLSTISGFLCSLKDENIKQVYKFLSTLLHQNLRHFDSLIRFLSAYAHKRFASIHSEICKSEENISADCLVVLELSETTMLNSLLYAPFETFEQRFHSIPTFFGV